MCKRWLRSFPPFILREVDVFECISVLITSEN